ncbi:MAG TPA: ribosome assembly RNA-binding protein YhbY [Clostridiales bacterium]|nr:ribosome assembly RNA-binding protein YhbY [Clostridiales bacterium]
MITSKQRSYLRSLAHTLSPIFQIGKGGVTEESCHQIANALEARELIKVRVLENSGYRPADAAAQIAEATGAETVGVIGSVMIFYKESEKKKRIELP